MDAVCRNELNSKEKRAQGGGITAKTVERVCLLEQTGRLQNHSVDAERLDQLQEIRSLNPQDLRGGGAVAAGLTEGLQHQLSPAGVDALPVRETGGRALGAAATTRGGRSYTGDRRRLTEHDGAAR